MLIVYISPDILVKFRIFNVFAFSGAGREKKKKGKKDILHVDGSADKFMVFTTKLAHFFKT